MYIRFIIPVLGLLIVSGLTTACTKANSTSTDVPVTPTRSPYRDLLDTEIRGIDDKTIEDYLTAKGMGLALPAELNGYPGPRHVIDLADDLELTPEQNAKIQILFDEMQTEAITLGEGILAAEAALEADFRNQTITEAGLNSQLKTIEEMKAALRFVHLITHLATIEILLPHQVRRYNTLRGYEDMPASHERHQHEG